MIRYLIDGRALQDRSSVRGIGTYVRGLLAGFAELGVISDVGLLTAGGLPIPAEARRLGCAIAPATVPVVLRRLQPLLDPWLVGVAVRRVRPQLHHAVEYAQPLRSPVPVVVTVHDLIPFVMPSDYPWMRRERLLALRQLRHADAVIADSRSTAHDLERLAGVDPARITVVHLAVSDRPPIDAGRLEEVRHRLHLPERFVLAVGTFDPRKRLDALVAVVAEVRRHHDVGLVIAGAQGAYGPAVSAAVAAAGIGGATRITGFVDPSDLAALYRMASCLVYTSAYEGFGLPPLEAMASGTPVALFHNSSLPEVVGDAALLVPDGDVPAMVAAITALLGDPAQGADLARAGSERAARFTWRRTAEETLAVYEFLLAR